MPILSERDRDIIRNRFDKELVDDVNLAFVMRRESPLLVPGREGQTQEAAACREEQQLLEELIALSPKLHLEIHDAANEADRPLLQQLGVEVVPALILSRDGRQGVRFYGLTSGYEFATVIEDIVDLSRNQTGLAVATQQALESLAEAVHIRVFVTPT